MQTIFYITFKQRFIEKTFVKHPQYSSTQFIYKKNVPPSHTINVNNNINNNMFLRASISKKCLNCG